MTWNKQLLVLILYYCILIFFFLFSQNVCFKCNQNYLNLVVAVVVLDDHNNVVVMMMMMSLLLLLEGEALEMLLSKLQMKLQTIANKIKSL